MGMAMEGFTAEVSDGRAEITERKPEMKGSASSPIAPALLSANSPSMPSVVDDTMHDIGRGIGGAGHFDERWTT
jgi:hypothetical protein